MRDPLWGLALKREISQHCSCFLSIPRKGGCDLGLFTPRSGDVQVLGSQARTGSVLGCRCGLPGSRGGRGCASAEGNVLLKKFSRQPETLAPDLMSHLPPHMWAPTQPTSHPTSAPTATQCSLAIWSNPTIINCSEKLS